MKPAELPNFQNDDQVLQLMQSRWAAILNPFLQNPTNCGRLITGISIQAGPNIIYHQLGRKMQGWVVVDQTAVPDLYRLQPLNDQTLALNASVPATISLWVF